MHGERAGEGPCGALKSGSGAPPGKRNGATSSRRADQGRDCGAAETQRVAENAPRWAEMNASRRDMRVCLGVHASSWEILKSSAATTKLLSNENTRVPVRFPDEF